MRPKHRYFLQGAPKGIEGREVMELNRPLTQRGRLKPHGQEWQRVAKIGDRRSVPTLGFLCTLPNTGTRAGSSTKIEREEIAIKHAIEDSKGETEKIKSLLMKRAEGFLVCHE